MRKINKPTTSSVLSKKLVYKVNGNNKQLSELLKNEQNNICAYTELYLGRGFASNIDHFDPTLKGQSTDSYKNWFLVSAQWNNEKSAKWTDSEPILHPTAHDLEARVIYVDGEYGAADPSDVEANNLIRLVKLDDADLADRRKNYIKRKKKEIAESLITAQEYMDELMTDYPEGVYFIRAIEEELNVKVNFDLLRIK